MSTIKRDLCLPGFIVDLAQIEWALYCTRQKAVSWDRKIDTITVNPTLTLLSVGWENLVKLVKEKSSEPAVVKKMADVYVMVWRDLKTDKVHIREAGDIDLLSLKIVVEKIPFKSAAESGGVTIGAIESSVNRAIAQGILIGPDSRIRRNHSAPSDTVPEMASYMSADIFTLQWHITQACDLHCKHCYDRSKRTALTYHHAKAILDDFYSFCSDMNVRGQVTFTGGNPLLYPRFDDIYRKAAEFGFGIAILGNPSPIEKIKALVEIEKPLFFQISLEGLEAHNDSIRGVGHFKRSLRFLDELRELDIYTMVMLTLTRDNIDQVLKLAGLLRDRTDFFTFNRLSTVGEGASLLMSEPREFESFLRAYEAACQENPILGMKDNLTNIIRLEKGRDVFGGCTGYGCGAAFNFVAIISNGDVHACRKFPSLIGNILDHRLGEIYHSDLAQAYRKGSQACHNCPLNIVCRGCMAITYSQGLDVFKEKDPFCFLALNPKKSVQIE